MSVRVSMWWRSLIAFLLVAVALAVAPLAPAAPAADAPPASPAGAATAIPADWVGERWFVARMFDEKVGWLHSTRSVDERGNLVSSEVFQFSMSRMGQDIAIEMRSRFVETPDGAPVEIESMMGLGSTPTTTVYRFEPGSDKVTVITQRDDGERVRTIKRPGGTWLTPAQVHRFVAKRLEAGASTIAYATIDASSGLQVVLVRATVKERTTVEALGKRVPAILWESTTSLMPDVTMHAYVDMNGQDIRSTVNLGGTTMELIATEREVALSPFKAPEVMASTTVSPVGEIHRPRRIRQAAYELTLTGKDQNSAMPALVRDGPQRVTPLSRRSARVEIDLDAPKLYRESQRSEWFDERTLGSSSMIDLDDAMLKQTLAQALRDVPADATGAQKAEAIRKFVFRYINHKNLGVGFASASETCRTREGDCSEHATLLAALLRLAGIPARTVSGLVYVDQFMDADKVFGFHMWTQALLPASPTADGEARWAWVDLDAALSYDHPTDAARIAVVTSTLADDDTINSMVDVALLMGQLAIEVVLEQPAPR